MPSTARERTPEEIRASIEHNRMELATSLDKLRGEVVQLTDWRSQLRARQQQVTVGAAATGFFLGGGVAAIGSLVFGRKARKARRRASRS